MVVSLKGALVEYEGFEVEKHKGVEFPFVKLTISHASLEHPYQVRMLLGTPEAFADDDSMFEGCELDEITFKHQWSDQEGTWDLDLCFISK